MVWYGDGRTDGRTAWIEDCRKDSVVRYNGGWDVDEMWNNSRGTKYACRDILGKRSMGVMEADDRGGLVSKNWGVSETKDSGSHPRFQHDPSPSFSFYNDLLRPPIPPFWRRRRWKRGRS